MTTRFSLHRIEEEITRNRADFSDKSLRWVNRVEVCRGEGESFANNSIRPNLPICFPFTASLYLFSPSPLPLSFFILSRIFFFLPFLLPRRARRERERIRNWVGEEANHAEKMKYRGKLRVNADARVGWVRRFGRVPTTCWPMRRIWPNAKFGKSNEGTRFFLSLFLSLVFLWRLTVYRDFSKERGLFSLSTRIYIYLFQLFNKVYKKSCRY